MKQYFDTLQDLNGNAIVGPAGSIIVKNYPSGSLASIFNDNGLTPIANSAVTADSTGQVQFFAADGDYIVECYKNALLYKTLTPFSLFDGAAQVTVVTTGSPNAYAVAGSQLEKTLRAGLRCYFQANFTNTGAATLQYNGLAAKNLIDTSGNAVAAGTFVSGTIYGVEYNGTAWQIFTWTVTQGSLAQILFPRTAAEIAAGVTPTNFTVPSHDQLGFVLPTRYGGVSDDTTDSTTALANSLLVCAQSHCPLNLSDGSGYLCTANLSVPVGSGNTVDIFGSGWATGGIHFSGASVTTGLTYTGSGFSYAGALYNCRVRGTSSAVRGVTYTDCAMPRISRCFITGFAGAGAAFLGTILGKLEHTLLTGCGSATEGSVEVDRFGAVQSTTWMWDHSYISGGTVTVGGLIVNRTPNVTIIGGAIESSGIQIRIGHRADAAVGCFVGLISGIDLENPGNNNCYIEFGAGLSGSAVVRSWGVNNVSGYPSSTTTVTNAIQASVTQDLQIGPCNFSVPNGTSFFELKGTLNLGAYIAPMRSQFNSSGIPWVRVNSTQVMAAGAQTAWSQTSILPGLTTQKVISGTTATVNVSDTQGGYHRVLATNNGGATSMTTLTGGENGMEIFIRAGDVNTTLVHNTATTDGFNMVGGANLLLTANKVYQFLRSSTQWVQV